MNYLYSHLLRIESENGYFIIFRTIKFQFRPLNLQFVPNFCFVPIKLSNLLRHQKIYENRKTKFKQNPCRK